MHRYSPTLFIYIGSNRWVALFACLLLLVACQEQRTYSHYATVEVEGWERSDTVTFAIPPQHAGTYDLQLGLRATNTYPFTHLSMLMEQTRYRKTAPAQKGEAVSGGKTGRWQVVMAHCDTVRCQIADANGLLLGKNGISSTELTYPLAQLHLQEGDSLSIKLSHCMERESLTGVADVGITLNRH